MNTDSRKAKGRRLQQWLVKQIQCMFPELPPEDVKSTPMGSRGEDVWMSNLYREMLPYSFECKNNKSGYSKLYEGLAQAEANAGDNTPVLLVKQDREEPLVVMRWADWQKLDH